MSNRRLLPVGLVVDLDPHWLPKRTRYYATTFGTPTELPADYRISMAGSPPLAHTSGSTIRGSYRGLPWWLTQTEDATVPRIEFFAAAFRDFLFKRIVWLPLMKNYLAKRGGIAMAGSAYVTKAGVTLLLGGPGSGKTKTLISAVNAGAVAVGDSEVGLIPGKGIVALTPDLDLRVDTVRDSDVWATLSARERLQIRRVGAMSHLLGERLNFSWGTQLSRCLPTTDGVPLPNGLLIECLSCSEATPQSVVDFATADERRYVEAYGARIYSEEDLTQAIANLKQFLSGEPGGETTVRFRINKK